MVMGDKDEASQLWEDHYQAHRNFLIAYSFRMTGSLSDAEDIVQDAISECLRYDPNAIQNPRAWMTRICSNKALDLLKSSAKKRNEYIGTWLPDAIPESFHLETQVASFEMAADSKVELSESLTMSFLILLQNLNPVERSIFLLKEIFDYSFKEVSELVGKSETACRKIAERARDSLQDKERKFPKPPADSEKLIRQFFEAAKLGDRPRLMSLLSEKSEFLSDGGGKVSAAPPMLGAPEKIAEFFLSLRNYPVFTSADYRMETKWVNSRPGMIISKRATDGLWYFETIISCEIENNQIARMFSQRNPDKLNRLTFMDRGK